MTRARPNVLAKIMPQSNATHRPGISKLIGSSKLCAITVANGVGAAVVEGRLLGRRKIMVGVAVTHVYYDEGAGPVDALLAPSPCANNTRVRSSMSVDPIVSQWTTHTDHVTVLMSVAYIRSMV